MMGAFRGSSHRYKQRRNNRVCIISEHQVARQISAVIEDTGPKENRLPSQSLLTNWRRTWGVHYIVWFCWQKNYLLVSSKISILPCGSNIWLPIPQLSGVIHRARKSANSNLWHTTPEEPSNSPKADVTFLTAWCGLPRDIVRHQPVPWQ